MEWHCLGKASLRLAVLGEKQGNVERARTVNRRVIAFDSKSRGSGWTNRISNNAPPKERWLRYFLRHEIADCLVRVAIYDELRV